jgi:hypothetical protein
VEDEKLSEDLMRRDIEIIQLRRALNAAQDEIERSITARELLREQITQLVALIEHRPHMTCEDMWYSCAQATGDYACCDDSRAGGPCDCGRDALVAKAHTIIVGGAS